MYIYHIFQQLNKKQTNRQINYLEVFSSSSDAGDARKRNALKADVNAVVAVVATGVVAAEGGGLRGGGVGGEVGRGGRGGGGVSATIGRKCVPCW